MNPRVDIETEVPPRVTILGSFEAIFYDILSFISASSFVSATRALHSLTLLSVVVDGCGLWDPRLSFASYFTPSSAADSHVCYFVESSSSNQPMKPTAPLLENFSVFATTPCRGLSLSR
jgi:hypothetical protein